MHDTIFPFHFFAEHKHTNKTNSVAFSPQANYTDWATATCRRNLVPTFADKGVSRGQRGGSPTAVNLSFLDGHEHTQIKTVGDILSVIRTWQLLGF
jgi:hypothetical protein